MLRLGGVVELVVSSVVVACVGAAVVIGCGRAEPTSQGAHAGDAGATVSVPGVTGLVAGNGVPIPDPPLPDPCATLGIAVMACGATGACAALTCTCGGVQQTIEVAGSCGKFGACLTGISCPAACAHPDLLGAGAPSACVQAGVCMTDADCTNPARPRCLVAGKDTSGHCVNGQVDSECYRDADCPSPSVCVAIGPGPRVCIDNQMGGGPCNRDDQCPATANGTGRNHCVLPAGGFVGQCSNGAMFSACDTATDCLAGYGCAGHGSPPGTCTSRAQGAPCAVNGDCAQGRCVDVGYPGTSTQGTFGVCETGDLGTSCLRPSDCLSGFCPVPPGGTPGGAVCTTGANGAACIIDADCATQLCAIASPNGSPGQCTDGMQGSPCWGTNGKQCQAGLVCAGIGAAGTCVTAGSVGAPCQQDSDCLAQKCALPALPSGPGVCTEGKRGQRCDNGSQCDAGLHCFSGGSYGICLAGAPGDPCRVAGDCASGTCLGTSGATPVSCSGVGDPASCGVTGSCVGGVCLAVCM
jgi:hypothetical protein